MSSRATLQPMRMQVPRGLKRSREQFEVTLSQSTGSDFSNNDQDECMTPTKMVATDARVQSALALQDRIVSAVPPYWSVADPSELLFSNKVEEIFVSQSSAEWMQQLEPSFRRALARLAKSGAQISVYRIQNTAVYRQYWAHRTTVANRNAGQVDEALLWHGASRDATKAIVKEGFDMRLSEVNNAMGPGIYFAEDALLSLIRYSITAQQSMPFFGFTDVRGLMLAKLDENIPYLPPGSYEMIASRVIRGRSTPGVAGLRRPPALPDKTGLYDSVTGQLLGVNTWCVYDNAACYPAYRICISVGVAPAPVLTIGASDKIFEHLISSLRNLVCCCEQKNESRNQVLQVLQALRDKIHSANSNLQQGVRLFLASRSYEDLANNLHNYAKTYLGVENLEKPKVCCEDQLLFEVTYHCEATRAASFNKPQSVSHLLQSVDCSTVDRDTLCPICVDTLADPNLLFSPHVVALPCTHLFHTQCMADYHASSGHSTGLTCPVCRAHFGEALVGTQPNGRMHADLKSGWIEIDYVFADGVQSAFHPLPGTPYRGTTRKAFLQNTPDGRRVLELLKKAFLRGLIFTVGTSLTTNQANCVIWNGIHHKTAKRGTAHSFPDPTYYSRVTEELASLGIC